MTVKFLHLYHKIFFIVLPLMLTFLMADEWKNFLARIGRDENALDSELFDNATDILELRFWASYRGQTLARTGKYFSQAMSLVYSRSPTHPQTPFY